MQSYGIKIRFMSGCSAGAARVVRDDEVEGSNPFTLQGNRLIAEIVRRFFGDTDESLQKKSVRFTDDIFNR